VAARSGVLEVEDGDWFVGGWRKRRFMVRRCAWNWFYGGKGSSFACGEGLDEVGSGIGMLDVFGLVATRSEVMEA